MTDDTLDTIRNIVNRHLPDRSYKAFVFGSRATGTNRPFSDIDLGILGRQAISGSLQADIEDAFEDSDLPYRVDVVDFWGVSERFKKHAMQHIIPLN